MASSVYMLHSRVVTLAGTTSVPLRVFDTKGAADAEANRQAAMFEDLVKRGAGQLLAMAGITEVGFAVAEVKVHGVIEMPPIIQAGQLPPKA